MVGFAGRRWTAPISETSLSRSVLGPYSEVVADLLPLKPDRILADKRVGHQLATMHRG